MHRCLLLAFLILGVPLAANADALPDCPEGTHLEENPVEPGAMHHNGGECVPNAGSGGCDVASIASSGSGWTALALAAAGLLAGARRRRHPPAR